ncbi:hypothetical protein KSP39_PZI016284 [Platanthera zijinensis]|uniref:Uncharacterized protein n=1 Tax=Platanthera zijinensis TaxID=2320716 RepID=A0AAP0G149_9ASPA
MEAVMRAQIRVRMQRVNMVTEGEEMQFVVMSSQNKVEKLKFKAAKPSTSALEVLSEKGHQHLHNNNNGSLSFERGISAKPSKRYNTKPDKKLNAAEARCSNPGRVKENNSITNNLTKTYPLNLQCKQNHRDLLTSASDFGFSKSPASSLSSSSSSISRPILLESEGTEEVSSNNHHNYITLTESIEAKKRTACAEKMSRFYRELQCDMD